jgi:hypothetical protein
MNEQNDFNSLNNTKTINFSYEKRCNEVTKNAIPFEEFFIDAHKYAGLLFL